MKQTTKRVLSMVLSMLMLFSAMSVFTFAENNYKPDDEYYDRIINDAVIVNTEWQGYSDGDQVSYTYRGKNITETFDSNIHFSSVNEAYDYCCEMNIKNPVIIICSGTVLIKDLTISESVTILGANAGINPNIIPDDPEAPWSTNYNRGPETILRGVIDVAKTIKSNVEIVLDGVTLASGFAYVDAIKKTTTSSAVLRNSIIKGAGGASYGITAVTNVFFFASAMSSVNNVKIENVRCTNMKTTSITGTGVTNLEISGLCYTGNTSPAIEYGDAPTDQNANYVIRDSMFYNNKSASGVLAFDHSIKDSGGRSDTYTEIKNCVFKDDLSSVPDEKDLTSSPILYTVVSSKNRLDIHDNVFIGAGNYSAPVVDYTYTQSAITGAFFGNINVYSNDFIGYCNLNDTSGISADTRMSYTGNYFADYTGAQIDPVYPTEASEKNISVDYYWIDRNKTVPSSIYHVTSTGIANAEINNVNKTIKATLDYGDKVSVNFAANDSSVVYELYDETMTNKITEIDSKSLISGDGKNIFYAVGTSTKSDYKFIYTVYVSTYNPAFATDFNLKDTYLLAPDVAEMPAGTVLYKTWQGSSYKFTVGVNAFATAAEIISICDTVPTIIMPAGKYTNQITLTGSAVVLGEKHGVNPNIPHFDKPDTEWQQNPERMSADKESVLEGCVIGTANNVANATVVIDGFVFGAGSGVVDRGLGLTSYSTSIIKNSVIDGAADFTWTEDGNTTKFNTIFAFGGGGDDFINNHKDIRLVNIRMVAQGMAQLIGDYFESLIMDGVYVSANRTTLHKNEWTHPKNQNFYLEIRNSCFFGNETGTYYFLVNNNINDSAGTTSNRVVLDNNIFYNTSTNLNGIFGIRFCGKKDSLRFVNNTFISSNSRDVMPGSTNWFLGVAQRDHNKEYTEEQLSKIECVNDVVMNFNHFIKCTRFVDMSACKEGTVWDMNYNYFAETYNTSTAGKQLELRDGYKEYANCKYYYTDWDLTKLNEAPKDDSFNKELKYSINGSGVIDTAAKTYTDTVATDVKTYDFGIDLETPQASYGVYSDAECKNKVNEPVALTGSENVFYIKLSSYDGTVSDIYTARITRPLGSGADIVRFGNWRVTSDSVYACVPIGETEFVIPDVAVSSGASYAIYSDKTCETVFDYDKVTDIGAIPVILYIKVNSEDGNKSKIYTFSVLQSENDQAEVTYIDGAYKVSDTEFEAVIPGGSSSFEISLQHSENAEISVYDAGQQLRPSKDGIYTVDNILTVKTVDIIAKSVNGLEKTFKLTIKKDNSSCEVTSVFGMINNGDNTSVFEARTNANTFKVVPYLANPNATYGVYSDRECNNICSNDTVALTGADSVAYLKVTSADGKASRVYTLKIHTSSSDFAVIEPPVESKYYEVVNATQTENGKYYIEAAENLSEYEFKMNILDDKYAVTSYSVFTDADCTTRIGLEHPISEAAVIPVASKLTNVYVKIWVKTLAEDGTTQLAVQTDVIKVTINSNRPKAVYNDADKISGWALEQINFLNDNGFGYFQGDNGNFRPKDSITRFEVAAIAIRVLGIDQTMYNSMIIPYTDNIPNWAGDYVKACYKLGIMTGVDQNTFDGKKSTTRQEFAKIAVSTVAIARGDAANALELYNASQAEIDAAYNERGFADENNISDWAKPFVRLAVVKYGLINGSNDYGVLNINPKSSITRQEVAVILANYNGYTK